MIISLEKIKTALRLEDIEGLIEIHGAPENEYDVEAEELFRLLDGQEVSQEQILAVLIPLWARYFDLDAAALQKRHDSLKNAARLMAV